MRCVEVWGNMAVSGSYDNTAKVSTVLFYDKRYKKD